jgi:hypothetical protein
VKRVLAKVPTVLDPDKTGGADEADPYTLDRVTGAECAADDLRSPDDVTSAGAGDVGGGAALGGAGSRKALSARSSSPSPLPARCAARA